jgi:AraC-like DNA-binding protein
MTVECIHVELWSGGGLTIESRRCDYGSEGWTDQLQADSFGLLLPIAGAYRLRIDGVTQFVDRGCGHFRRRGDEVFGSGITRTHVSTALYVDVDRFDSIDGADWPVGERLVDARLDFLHRLLRRELQVGLDPGGIEMRAVEVIGAALAVDAPPARRPLTTAVRYRQIAAQVLEALHADASFSLVELSRAVGCSPFHLSRIFHQTTGVTLRQYRARARLQAALDLLEQGARDLSAVAAACGFADHSHLTRTATAQLDVSPSRLRELLVDPSCDGLHPKRNSVQARGPVHTR